jgi:signal transduction histidine kinase
MMRDDGTLLLWEWKSGRPVLPFGRGGPGARSSWPPSFSADDRWMAIVSSEHQGKVVIVDLETGQMELPPVPVSPRRQAKLSPRGDVLAVAVDKDVQLRRCESGELLRTLSGPAEVQALFWDRTGQRLATGCRDANIYVWDVENGVSRSFVGHSGLPWSILFSPDGSLLASVAADGSSRLWDVQSGRAVCRVTEAQLGQFFSPDGRRIAFGRAGVTVGVWRMTAGPHYRVLRGSAGETASVWNQDLSPDGRWLVWARPSWVKPSGFDLFDLKSDRPPLFEQTDNQCLVALHPREPRLFVIDAKGLVSREIQEVSNGTEKSFQLGPRIGITMPAGFRPLECSLNADGQVMAVVGRDGRVLIADSIALEPITYLEGRPISISTAGPGSLTGSGRIAVSPDGRWAAIGFGVDERRPSVWDARTGKLLRRLPGSDAAVAFSPDGRWLVTAGERAVSLWSTTDWQRQWRKDREGVLFERGAAAFARDGALMAIARSQDAVQLLDVVSGEEIATLAAPDPLAITGLRLSADGSTLAVPGPDARIQLWDLRALRGELAKLGLDWGAPLRGPTVLPAIANPRPIWATPAAAILFGLACVALAAFFALLALRRHRGLVQQFVQTEAEAQQRGRELEVAQVELMHSQKMKALGTLAAGIAHDFNNLLSVIRMSNKLIGREVKGNPEVAEEVANIEEAVQQGKQVVASMLGYSRERPDDNDACDLDEVVEDTVSLLSKEFLSGIELTLALDRDAPPVQMGRGRLEQILLNLVVNAAEAMKGQGKLKIGVHVRSAELNGAFIVRPRPAVRYVELSVVDSGPGMAPEILPRIFEPFFTTKTTGTRQGTGLGLSMVYTIAEQDGLGITVETEPGHGTTFRVVVPVNHEESSMPKAQRSREGPTSEDQ